jgi:hypothetical protein
MVPTQKYGSILPLCSQLSAKTQLNASLEQPKQQKNSKSMARCVAYTRKNSSNCLKYLIINSLIFWMQ